MRESCIVSQRCDESEVIDQLGRHGRDFCCVYAGQIDRLKEKTLIVYLGDGLARFAARFGGCGGQEGAVSENQ